MRTATPTAPFGSLHPLTKLAFYDELEKISREVRPDAQVERAKLKRFVKGTLAVSAGTAAGTGAFMLTDRAWKALAPKSFSKLSPQARYSILAPVAALAGGGAALLAKKTMEDKHRYVEGR